MNSIIQLIGTVIRSWVGGDRIRISPTQGRLLGLKPGDRLVIRNEIYCVRTRMNTSGVVIFHLDDSQQDCQLVMSIQGIDDLLCGVTTFGQLYRAGESETIFDDDILLLPAEASDHRRSESISPKGLAQKKHR
ncbi:MAG: hypothetical protein WBD20_02345 [Pirellulaceae bacterium]